MYYYVIVRQYIMGIQLGKNITKMSLTQSRYTSQFKMIQKSDDHDANIVHGQKFSR